MLERSNRPKSNSPAIMNSPANLFTGFTRLCKGLAVVLVTGYIAVQIFPSLLTYLALIPARLDVQIRLSLAPLVIGVSMASLTEHFFNRYGFSNAMISNISFTYRSIYSKKAMVKVWDDDVFAQASLIPNQEVEGEICRVIVDGWCTRDRLF